MKDNAEMTKEELIALGWVKNPLDKMQEKTEKQLTAVEYLEYMLTLQGALYKNDIDKALEMEKEQKIEFAKNCLQENDCFFDIEQYYNETFKSE